MLMFFKERVKWIAKNNSTVETDKLRSCLISNEQKYFIIAMIILLFKLYIYIFICIYIKYL